MSLPKPYYHDERAGITIYHGDAREILPHLPDANFVLTDPPYNVGLGSKPHSSRQNGYKNQSDNLNDEDYSDLLSPCFRLIKLGCRMFVTPGVSNQHLWPKPKWTLAWTKANGVTRTPLTRGQEMNHSCWEPILIYGKLDHPPHSDVINLPIGLQQEADGHPCPKPIKLFQRLISFTDSETIIDPFMGSGTTLRAAKDLGRKAIGIEIEERYAEIAAKRLEQEVLPLSFESNAKANVIDRGLSLPLSEGSL